MEVSQRLNEGAQNLKVLLPDGKLAPVANSHDFRALELLQVSSKTPENAPLLAQQLHQLSSAGFSLSGLAGYPAYLALQSGQKVDLHYLGHPIVHLSGSDLSSLGDPLSDRRQPGNGCV